MCDIFQLLPVASEEDSSCPRSISNTDNIALDIRRAIRGGIEGLI